MPTWVVPRELLDDFLDLGNLNTIQYGDLLNSLDQQQELQFQDLIANSGNWFHQLQIIKTLKEDKQKKNGFR